MRRAMFSFLFLLFFSALPSPARGLEVEAKPGTRRVVILPIRDDIMPPLVYLIRRGVKEAMDWQADLLVVDMETDGGRVDSMIAIIEALNKFKGETVTFVNKRAFSAGALISFATRHIYMAPGTVIGAAAPVMATPDGASAMPETMEVKSASAISAMMRVNAEKNGHNPNVVDAMVKKTAELVIDGKVINRKGEILTLTNLEAEKEYGDPPKPLLSAGTVENLDALIAKLGYAGAEVKRIEPTGAEKLATWINALNWLWLILGAAGIYIEFKTPGAVLPAVIGVCGFALYFLGSYVAGLSGLGWAALFVVGLILVAVELFALPGTVIVGLIGVGLMLVALVMALVDHYPGMPSIPTLPQLQVPLRELGYAAVGTIVLLLILSRILPKTSVYSSLVAQSASGVESVKREETRQASHVGLEGKAISNLRPGGKAQFGDEILDVMTQGELVAKGTRVRILDHSGREAIVEVVKG